MSTEILSREKESMALTIVLWCANGFGIYFVHIIVMHVFIAVVIRYFEFTVCILEAFLAKHKNPDIFVSLISVDACK